MFISHASEDKIAIAAPLANRLKEMGISVWYDDFILKLGDNLVREIDPGLRSSKYGVVVLSKAFFSKDWTQYELEMLSSIMASRISKRKLNLIKVKLII